MNQYEPWIAEGITEAEYFKRRYIEARQELSEALANEQSSAKAYAESQAREVQYRSALERISPALGDRLLAYGPLSVSYAGSTIKAIEDALSLPAPDLVGVIKTLSAAAEALCGKWLDDSDQVMPEAFIARSNMRKVLASTLEIRERIGAT
jgi:hypothetical protein